MAEVTWLAISTHRTLIQTGQLNPSHPDPGGVAVWNDEAETRDIVRQMVWSWVHFPRKLLILLWLHALKIQVQSHSGGD